MDSFKIYSQSDILAHVNEREGEIKLGEKVKVYDVLEKGNEELISFQGLQQSAAKFVLIGIPEDIGVRANLGIAGTKTCWNAALKSILNLQSNSHLSGEEILVLGHFVIEESIDQSLQGLRKKVNEIDELVYPIIEKIVRTGKVPIVIGGGHNNAFPIIKGVVSALKKTINVINIDAHADLRPIIDGRHSGNGFSYALAADYLNLYHIFGLHQNYTNQNLVQQLAKSETIKAVYFEDMLLSEKNILQQWVDFTDTMPMPCGLEIDVDSIENVLSSAISPSGFALNDIRKILRSNTKPYSYLHLCEAATELENGKKDFTTGKAIAYLVSDFIKALRPHISPQP